MSARGRFASFFYRDAHRACGNRLSDPVAARVIELDKGFAAALVDGVGEPLVLFDHLVRREGELSLGGAAAFRDAAVLRDDDPRAAEDGAIPVILYQLLRDVAVMGLVRLHGRHDKPVADLKRSDLNRVLKQHGSPFLPFA